MPIDTSMLFKAGPIDVAGALQKGAESQQAQVTANTAISEAERQKQDDAAMRDYLKVTKNDMATAKGMDSALKDLQGRISPKSYLGMVAAKDKLLSNETEHVTALAKFGEDERKAYSTGIDLILKSFGTEDIDTTDPVASTARRADVIKRLSEVKTPSGQPQFNPQALNQVASLSPEDFSKLFKSSKHAGDLLTRAEAAAKIKREESQARLYDMQADAVARGKSVAGTENLYDPEGNVYANIPGKGIMNLATQEPFGGDVAALKPVPSVKGMKAGAAPVDRYKQAADNIDFEKNPPTPVEIAMAREFIPTGKMPSLGQNSPLRPRIAALAAKIALDESIDIPGARVVATAEKGNVGNLSKQFGVIKAGEETVLGNLELMKPIIRRVDASGVPALERWIRAGKRSIAGDKDVAQLDALITSTQADIGKVLSAATGAAGVPVEALKKAEKYMGGDLTVDQFDALYEIVPKEMAVRTDAMQAQIQKSLAKIAGLGKGKVSKDDQAARDSDAVSIQRAELVKARQQVRDLKSKGGDPAAIQRAESDVTALEKELKRAGATFEPTATPAKAAEKTTKSGKKFTVTVE